MCFRLLFVPKKLPSPKCLLDLQKYRVQFLFAFSLYITETKLLASNICLCYSIGPFILWFSTSHSYYSVCHFVFMSCCVIGPINTAYHEIKVYFRPRLCFSAWLQPKAQ